MSKGRRAWRCPIILAAGLGLVLILSGCYKTFQTRGAKPSGFLGSYSHMVKGGVDQAQYVYFNKEADFSVYDKLLIDPVTIWVSPGSDMSEVPREELDRLANFLYVALYNALKRDYTIVNKPGPNVMRLRVAITEAKESSVGLDIVSTIVPQMVILSGLKLLATGTATFVGKAAIEAELVHSLSPRYRLVAMIDERAGGKSLDGVDSKWDDVEEAYRVWARKFRERMAGLRTMRR